MPKVEDVTHLNAARNHFPLLWHFCVKQSRFVGFVRPRVGRRQPVKGRFELCVIGQVFSKGLSPEMALSKNTSDSPVSA